MKRLFIGFFYLWISTPLLAAHSTVNLVVDYKTVNFANKNVKTLAINDQIPAPTLHFKEGDTVTINVRNELALGTSIHWHGIILPWQMDGVEGITQRTIKPGETFRYQFTLKQAGTYWYHSHAGVQEQQGLYGAIIVDPMNNPIKADKDFAIVLSDWSNTYSDQILANLKKKGDYYSPLFPMQPSLIRFVNDYQQANKQEKKQLIDDYSMMQQMRMSIYDINDVAYDAILLNGHPKTAPWIAQVKVGDIVRLRFIGAGGNSIFHVKLPDNEMTVVHVQGNDVKPYPANDFTLAPGETLDVLVKIKQAGPQLIYVESMEKIGVVYGALITSPRQVVSYQNVKPFPCPLPVTREMATYGGHQQHGSMNHGTMDHGAMEHKGMGHTSAANATNSQVDKTKYSPIKALYKTNDPNKPIAQTINMTLDGWMDRYIWFINGVPEHHAHPIIIKPNQRYRFVFKNTSMMHHPMHIHGHWFILRKGLGEYDPLLHTIDMPPGATIVADVDTDASGQWLFHCHLLYHMMSGMSRVFQYSTLFELVKAEIKPQNLIENSPYQNRPIVRVDEVRPIEAALTKHPMAHEHALSFANWLNVGADPFHNAQRLTFKGLYGSDHHKLTIFMNDAEIQHNTIENADVDIFYWQLIDQFWALKGGVNYVYRPASEPYVQAGIGLEGTLPFFIETDLRGYSHGGSFIADLEFERDTQITNNFFIHAGVRTLFASKTVPRDDIGSGLNQTKMSIGPYYRISPALNVMITYEHENSLGTLKRLKRSEGESTREDTLTFGFAALF